MSVDTSDIIGRSKVFQAVLNMLARVAPTEATVLVTGEPGTGKKLLVRALHRNSKRRDKPLVAVNCGAVPGDFPESELFGHEKGASAHALHSRAGCLEMAEGGTLFLDEIGGLGMSLQMKILRLLQEKEFERLGGSESIRADVRVIAATSRNLEEEVKSGEFREDLFYRLNVIPMELPPLRRRGDDVLLLAEHFLQKYRRGSKAMKISPEAREMLLKYPWPGNVRELENNVERLVVIAKEDIIDLDDLPEILTQDYAESCQGGQEEEVIPLKEAVSRLEKELIMAAINKYGSGSRAAKHLKIDQSTLSRKMQKYSLEGIKEPLL